MDVNFTSFNKAIGYNCSNREKPFYLLEQIIVIVTYANNKRKYFKLDDRNFTSDGCTLWKIFWLILGCPHKPEYLPASIIHDWILENPGIVNHNRKFSSRIFMAVLLKTGVNPIKAQIMYLAVEFWQWLTNLWRKKWKN